MTNFPAPLGGPPPEEIFLTKAPLVLAIAQVRFPPILAIRTPEAIIGFQEAIRATYPILEQQQVHHVVMGPTPQVRQETVWRFRDTQRIWTVSLATDFVAIEATIYPGHNEFLARLHSVLSAAQKALNPQEAIRLGLRYLDRIAGNELNRASELLRPDVLGVHTSSLGQAAQHLMTESLLQAQEGQIQARWGFLPANGTVDPQTLPPIADRSWILDLDMFTASARGFAPDELTGIAKQFAERIYAVFRWMVTEEFIRAFGGRTERAH